MREHAPPPPVSPASEPERATATPVVLRSTESAPMPLVDAQTVALRLAVHDLSRIEWIASLAVPEQNQRRYEIDFSLEVPANLYSPVNLWDYIQQFTRLQSPQEEGALRIDRANADELRRDALGVAHRLKLLRERFERAAAAASAELVEALHPSLEVNFTQTIDQAVALVAEMRSVLLREPTDGGQGRPAAALVREWGLADEWLSHQLLELLAAAQRSVDGVLLGPSSRLHELDTSWTERLGQRIASALAAELDHRRERGLLNPRADSPAELSAFVERGSHLKKHFQDVLFLDVSAYMVDYRLRNWTGVVAASLAAAFWLSFTLIPIGPGTRAGIGLGTFGVIFALAYALKDRVKELTRGWLAGRLTRLYGQRNVTLRLPARFDAARPVVVEARETCDCDSGTAEDPLNRNVGASRRVMIVSYRMRADVHAAPRLAAEGIRSIKHIFRYDLTPIFSRLDNAVKSVPILDPATRKVKFVDAPKEYRLPLKLQARAGAVEITEQAQLVVSKRGIERLERAPAD